MDNIINLTQIEARILGCLLEKEITTPEYYPLTLNALTNACNQKSNRNPVMQLEEKAVLRTIYSLRDKQLVWQKSPAGSRVPKYAHRIQDAIPLNSQQVCVICELLLRGPQTIGEIRTHTARLCTFENTGELQSVIDSIQTDIPLIVQLPRQPGKRENRYMHLLCGPVDLETAEEESYKEKAAVELETDDKRIKYLEEEISSLKADFLTLKQQFLSFKSQFD